MDKSQVTGIILAGGKGSRMGNVNKGLQLLYGKPLIEHVANQIKPLTKEIIISANVDTDRYQRYGDIVVRDTIDGFQGPLAGISSSLTQVKTQYCLIVPCDCPYLPQGFVEKLYDALMLSGAEVSIWKDGQTLQPLISMISSSLKPELDRYLASGERKVQEWLLSRRHVVVNDDDTENHIVNINTEADLSYAQHEPPKKH